MLYGEYVIFNFVYKMLVIAVHFIGIFQKAFIDFIRVLCCVFGATDVVENSKQPSRSVGIEKFADYAIVEERDGGPLDAFARVLILLRAQR